jgi:ribosomal protein L5
LLASERAFSVFFTLASADLVAFSPVALAAVATSQAFLEALSSASRDEMRALVVAKASAVQQKRKEKSSKEAKKGIQDKQSIGKKITLRGPSSFQILDTFIA